jgi:hypothetical protein
MKRGLATHRGVIVRLDRTIRYAGADVFLGAGDDWLPAFAAMTRIELRGLQ